MLEKSTRAVFSLLGAAHLKKCAHILFRVIFFNWTPDNVSRLRPWTVPLDWSPYIFLVLKSYSLLQTFGHFLIMGAEGGAV